MPHLMIEYRCSQRASTFSLSDWCSEGLDAIFTIEILESLPDKLLYSSFHPQQEFEGRSVSVGKVKCSTTFSASLIRIADGLLGCYENPFFNLSGLNADVVLQYQNCDERLVLGVFVSRLDSGNND
jgi:hypothetical protein